MRSPATAAVALLTLLLGLAPGCTRSRTFTIYSKPADAKLVINGVERGQGPITQRFDFGRSGAARVTAVRPGYQSETLRLTANTPRDTVVIELEPLGPKGVISIQPPAMVRVNGVPVDARPVREHEVTLRPGETYTVTAEQTGYARETLTIRPDTPGYYSIALKPLARDNGMRAQAQRPPERIVPDAGPGDAPQGRPTSPPPPATREAPVAQAEPRPQPPRSEPVRPNPPRQEAPRLDPPRPEPLRRNIAIRTEPAAPGAEIYIEGEKRGDKAVELTNHEFARDASGRPVPQQVAAVAPGFEGGNLVMRWEDNRSSYVVPLGRRRKEVRITTEPPGAIVTLNGRRLPSDRGGVSYDTLFFPPTEPPQGPVVYTGTAAPADGSAPFDPAPLAIRWDDGKQDYSVKLPPAKYVKVPTLQVTPAWDGRAWRASATRVETLAARDPSEGDNRPAAQPLAELPPATMLHSVIASPDGSHVLYTELIAGRGDAPLRAQMRLLDGDGSPGVTLPSDGRHFDAMPSFTPGGDEIVFTSDRSGAGLDVWAMKLEPGGGVRQLARGGEKAALWPMIDASPRPRLFYEEFRRPGAGATEALSEIHMVELEADPPTNKALSPGTRPRASPRADAVVFTRADPKTGKRDLYLVSERDGAAFVGNPVNLTRTPDVDEADPAWSRTGGKIAFASDAAADETGRRQYDLYVLTVSDPSKPVRVTHNGSVDDSPAWDPTGRSLFFRSNRGGRWGIWKIDVPQ